MGSKHKKTKVARVETGPILHWMACEHGDVHVFGPCPRCFYTKGGWLLGTSGTVSEGITRAKCADCGESIDYFVDPTTHQMWQAQAIREPVKATCAS
jgi:hypothetical protein